MNPYDRLRRPDFQAPNSVGMPWLEPPPMMDAPEDEGIGQNAGIMAGALKQRLMGNGNNPTAPPVKMPNLDINVAEPPIPAPNIPTLRMPGMDKMGGGMATGLNSTGGMKSL